MTYAKAILLIWLLGAYLGYCGPVQAQSQQSEPTWTLVDDQTHPKGQLQFQSLVFPCDGVSQPIPAFMLPYPVIITLSTSWIGTDAAPPGSPYPQADAFLVLYVSRPHGYRLITLGQDRYAAPNNHKPYVRSHDWRMDAGEMVGGGFACTAMWGMTSHIQITVELEFTKVQP